jgi:HEAT repeat protein
LGAALFLKQHLENTAAPPAGPEIAAPAPVASNVVAIIVPPPAPAPAVTNVLTPEQRQAAIDAETDRLQQWSMNDDPASLSNILADLTNPEKEVREAAIEAAEQFGSTNAIPTLKDLAAKTTDTEEQSALLEAAHFISLPSIFSTTSTPEQIQAAAQRKAEREASQPAQMQNPAPDQNSPAPPANP